MKIEYIENVYIFLTIYFIYILRMVLFCKEVKNEADNFIPSPWDSTYPVDLAVNHR